MTQTVPVLFVTHALLVTGLTAMAVTPSLPRAPAATGVKPSEKNIRLNMSQAVVIPADLPRYAASAE